MVKPFLAGVDATTLIRVAPAFADLTFQKLQYQLTTWNCHYITTTITLDLIIKNSKKVQNLVKSSAETALRGPRFDFE